MKNEAFIQGMESAVLKQASCSLLLNHLVIQGRPTELSRGAKARIREMCPSVSATDGYPIMGFNHYARRTRPIVVTIIDGHAVIDFEGETA